MTKTQMYATDTELSFILHEVKKHGFYSAFCDDLVGGLDNHDELILAIKTMAKHAHLQVNFNALQNVCIFEDLLN